MSRDTDIAAMIAPIVAAVLRHPDVVAALRANAPVEAPIDETAPLTSGELARAIGVSVAAVHRWSKNGMPGAERKGRRRFRVDEVRTWLAEVRPKPTKATPRVVTDDALEVSDVLRASRLRSVNR